MKNFCLIGVSGYIAPKHLKAIKDTNNNLLACLDKNDSVGIIDSFFPKASFFTELERYDRHIEKLKYSKNINVDYTTICTPNYLHDAHIRLSLRAGSNVICEKPLVLNPWNVGYLEELEKNTGLRVWNILQLRLHPSIIRLKNKIDNGPKNKVYDIDLTYLTSRGKWYYASWKGDDLKSGGVATNIGIHFFDMLNWIFGDVIENIIHIQTHDRASGYMILKKARVRWFLSINSDLIPDERKKLNKFTYRSIRVNNEEIDFTDGFTDLHTQSYSEILSGNGFGLAQAKPSIEIIHKIRNSNPIGLKGEYHPFAKFKISGHPFHN